MSDMRRVFIIVGFDAKGDCHELCMCEPSNPVAEALIASYHGPMVNVHWVVREVDMEAPTDLSYVTAADVAQAKMQEPAAPPEGNPPQPVETPTSTEAPQDSIPVVLEEPVVPPVTDQ